MLSKSCEAVENFLQDVDEQISCKIGLDRVNEELRGHIEDKAELYMEYGMKEEEAYRRSVRDMGAADVVGMELNKHHRLRTAKPLLAVILALLAVGLIGELLRSGISWDFYSIVYNIQDTGYYLWGLLVLFVVVRYGYPFLMKHTKGVCAFFFGACLFLAALYTSFRLFPGWLDNLWQTQPSVFWENVIWKIRRIFNFSLFVGIIQLSVPVGAVFLYRKRKENYKGIFQLLAFQAVLLLMGMSLYWMEAVYIQYLILLLSCLGATLYLVGKGWMNVPKRKGTAAALVSFSLLMILWVAPQWKNVKENLVICVDPGSRASVTDAWDDAYNNVLIRELLGRANAFGEIDLTDEELVRYGTSQWYYEDKEDSWQGFRTLEEHVKYRMQFLEEPELREILPQHYLENYRVSWWVLRYGWVPALLLTLLSLALPVLALKTAFRIRNRLGQLTAFSGALVFAVQTVIYLFENFGFQFGGFGNLPFVSEGLASITGSAVLAGLILSAYRFDTVVVEEKPIFSDSGRPEYKRKETQE